MSDDEALPRLLAGRYRLDEKLGSGGMGVVYRATDINMHRACAVKLIRGANGVAIEEDTAGRFLREAKNTARVQHEHIIEVYDLGRSDEGDLFFVMELLEGESLSAKLRRDGRLSPEEGVGILRQICAALHVAHAAGIIHRDLKPANVMLIRRAGRDDFVKVLDFGVAKSYAPDQETQLTHTGMLVGTVEYMAPEQIMGGVVDGRTDIYSLGIVMYRMFAGKPPFREGSVPTLIHGHLNVFPKPMTEVLPGLPGALDHVVLRCLAKQPDRRYESMAELSRALAAAMNPGELELMNFEYGQDDDPYSGAGDKTEVARQRVPPQLAPLRTPAPPQIARPRPPAPAPIDDYDDRTVRMDRVPPEAAGSPPRPPAPAAPPGRSFDPDEISDRTAVMAREESTAKRAVPEEVLRFEQSASHRECAMCRTLNVAHARACSACGVSLAREEQEAVRARVTSPASAGPAPPPGTSGAYAAPPFGYPPPQNPPGAPVRPPQPSDAWAPMQPYAGSPPGGTPSIWQRFLSWTGLRTR